MKLPRPCYAACNLNYLLKLPSLSFFVSLALASAACSSSPSGGPGTGGSSGTGGNVAPGGNTGTGGGGPGTGGDSGTGGSVAPGGSTGTGGVAGTGGNVARGGTTGTAGTGIGGIGGWGVDSRVANPTCRAPARPTVIPSGDYVPVALFPNLSTGSGGVASTNSPIVLRRLRLPTNQPDPANAGRVLAGTYHWIVGLRSGRIFDVTDVNAAAPPSTNLRAGTITADLSQGESGFLGMAFDPEIATNPARNHVYYVIAQYASWTLYRASLVTTASGTSYTYTTNNEVAVLTASATGHHHGGEVLFGPDGYLYLSVGEADIGARTQSPRNLRGKILRIDVRSTGLTTYYGVPANNPYRLNASSQANAACRETGEDAADQNHDCPEVYAVGFRNPFRFGFDRQGGALWVGDVGAVHEEINIVELGKNYGWNTYEGAAPLNNPSFVPQKAEIPRSGCTGYGYAIIGGFVYRGSAIPSLQGKYVTADNDAGKLYVVDDPYGAATVRLVFNGNCAVSDWHPSSFTEDENGELYAVSLNPAAGRGVFRITPSTPEPGGTMTGPPALLSATGCTTATGAPIAAAIPYGVNVELWSDGLSKKRWMAIPDSTTLQVATGGHLELPVGSVLIKEFSAGTRRIETRLLVRHTDGDWAGYTYLWNTAQTEAMLQDASVDVAMSDGGAAWSVPSRAQCLTCHTTSRQRTLGMELRQLNGIFTYPNGRNANNLDTLTHIGLLPAQTSPPAYPAAFGSGPIDTRARAYLDVNCGSCHPAPGNKPNFLFDTAAASRMICNELPTMTYDVGTRLLVPANPNASIMVGLMRSTTSQRMPRLGSRRVDTAGVQLISDWITQKTSCP